MQITFTFDNPGDAAKVLEFLNDSGLIDKEAKRPTTSAASASPTRGEAGGPASAKPETSKRNAEKPSKPDDHDPWANDGSSTETLAADGSETISTSWADDNDDDDPWS